MAPSCIPFGNGNNNGNNVFNRMAILLRDALNRALAPDTSNNNSLTQFRIDRSGLFNTPSQYEVSLVNIDEDLDRLPENPDNPPYETLPGDTLPGDTLPGDTLSGGTSQGGES